MSDRGYPFLGHATCLNINITRTNRLISSLSDGLPQIGGKRASIECLPLTLSFDWFKRKFSVVINDSERPCCIVGVAYVKYERASSAALAVENLHEVTLNNGSGPRLKVMLAESPSARYVVCRVYIMDSG